MLRGAGTPGTGLAAVRDRASPSRVGAETDEQVLVGFDGSDELETGDPDRWNGDRREPPVLRTAAPGGGTVRRP